MARNKGKRPGTASGTPSRQNDQAKNGTPTNPADGSAATSVSSSVSQTTSTDGKAATGSGASKPTPASSAAVSTSTVSSAAPSAAPSKVATSIQADKKLASSAGSVPGSKADPARKPATALAGAATTTTVTGDGGGSGGSGGFWPGLLGGLVGGGAIALAASLFWAGGTDDEALTALQSTTANLESRLSTTESQVADVGSLAERVAAVETTPATDGGAAGGENNELADRLADLEQQISALDAGGTESSGSENNDMEPRLAALEQQLGELNGALIASTESQQSTNDAMVAMQGLLPALQTTLAATGTTVEETGQQTAELKGSVDTLGQTTARLSGDLETLSGRIGETETKIDFIGGEYQRAAAMVVAIGDVDRSISKAEPYETSLESLRALGQDDAGVNEALTILEPMAADGVPTVGSLKASFGEVASQILLAKDGEATLTDQVSDNLFGVINMRPAGAAVEGDDSRAIVARAQSELSDNDLGGAIAELAVLEGAAKESASGWVASAQARLGADAAIADLRAHAQSLLAKGS